MAIFTAGRGGAGLPVTDAAANAKAIQQLMEMKKQLDEMKKMYKEMQDTAAFIGGVKNTIQSTAALSRSMYGASCLIPGLDDLLTLPKGFTPQYTDLCTAMDTAEKVLFPHEHVDEIDGEAVPVNDRIELTREQQGRLFKDSVVSSYALAMAERTNVTQTQDVARSLITEANAAPDVISVGRVQAKALAQLLSELGNLRGLLAAQLELRATEQAYRIPTHSFAETIGPRGNDQ